MRDVCFLQIKSFGDYVIANSAAERVEEGDRSRVQIAIGTHLAALGEALDSPIRTTVIETREAGVPAIFDLRKKGVSAAISSAFGVRRAIAKAQIDPNALILLDRVTSRERFLLGKRTAVEIKGARNIYAGYDQLMLAAGLRLLPPKADRRLPLQLVGIFPGSRLAEKNLPQSLITNLIAELDRRGVPHRLFLLDGERPDLESCGVPFERVPRQFSAMYDAVARCQLVVSADSMPAHLAERADADVFVFTPKPNEFWMPPSVYQARRWSVFGDPERMVRFSAMFAT
jgi:ADP-heptose:LPS heptosyltransferase